MEKANYVGKGVSEGLKSPFKRLKVSITGEMGEVNEIQTKNLWKK